MHLLHTGLALIAQQYSSSAAIRLNSSVSFTYFCLLFCVTMAIVSVGTVVACMLGQKDFLRYLSRLVWVSDEPRARRCSVFAQVTPVPVSIFLLSTASTPNPLTWSQLSHSLVGLSLGELVRSGSSLSSPRMSLLRRLGELRSQISRDLSADPSVLITVSDQVAQCHARRTGQGCRSS